MIDPVEFGKQIGVMVREATAPLLKRIEQLEQALEATETLDVADVVAHLLKTDQLQTLVDLQSSASIGKYFEENPVHHGKDGADGVGLAGAIINRAGELVVTKTNGDSVNLGVVIGTDGKHGDHGKDGLDGLGFDDADVSYDGERSFKMTWQRGEQVKTKTFIVPTVIDRGYWREGTEAKTGDAMTHDGTLWIALRDTKAKPARESEDWRIGARKGRDGVQGPPGKAYQAPEPVKLGGSNG